MRDNLFLYYGENANDKIRQNILCTARASRNEVFAGEPVTVTYTLCSALQSFSLVEKMPPFNGFSVYEIKGETPPVIQKVNGKLYNAYPVRKLQLYPTEPGTFILEPATIKNTITFQQSDVSNTGNPSLPDGFTPTDEIPGFVKTEYEYRCQSDQPVIRVLPVPDAGKPEGYSGAVGKFNISVSCSDVEAEKGGILKVTYTLTGIGNFKMINELGIPRSEEFEIFDPHIREELDENHVPFSGKKIFDYSYSPLLEGVSAIPPVRFSYFDPASRSFHLVQTDSLSIKVIASNERDAVVPVATTTTQKSNSVANYIVYIFSVAVLLLVVGLFWFRLRKRNAAQLKKKKEEPAQEEDIFEQPQNFFAESARLLRNEEHGRFFAMLNKELQMALTSLLQLPPGTAAGSIFEAIDHKNPQVANDCKELMEYLNRVIYAYTTPEAPPEWYYGQAKKIVEQLRV